MRSGERTPPRATALAPTGLDLAQAAKVPILPAENRLGESSNQIPCHLGPHRPSAHAQDVHVVVLNALTRGKVVVDQASPHAAHLVRAHRGPDPAAADRDPALQFLGSNGPCKRKNKIGIIIAWLKRMRAEINNLMTCLAQPPDEFLFQSESPMVRGQSDFHGSLMPDRRRKVNLPPAIIFAFDSQASTFIFFAMKRAILALLLAIIPLQASDLWSTNYEESLKKAAAENRMVLLEFTGSDWCPPCKKLAEDVFAQPPFAEFASANLVPVKLDFPRRAEQSEEQRAANQALAKKYQVEGFPTVILLDSKGAELAREVGYGGGGVTAFINWVNKNKK